MCRKLLFLVLVLALAGNASAELVGHWKLDEASGTIAYDSSGNGFDGTLMGGPQWVAGYFGWGLYLDGTDDYVEVSTPLNLNSNTATFTAWVNFDGSQPDWAGIWVSRAGSTIAGIHYGTGGDLRYNWNDATWSWSSGFQIPENEWFFTAVVIEPDKATLYMNEQSAVNEVAHAIEEFDDTLVFGQDPLGGRFMSGTIDDVRIYDHALSGVEILAAMESSEKYPYALGPSPKDGSLLLDTWVNLSWRAGDLAASHDVYIGENFDDVNSGAEGTFRANQASTFYVVGFPGFPFPDGLVPGTTYYWRIDEVNDTEPNSPWKGDIWSFSIPPKTAYFPDPADSAESVDPDVQLSWTAGFGAKLHTVYFGENFDDVNNAAGGLPQGATTYTPDTLKLAKTYYWRVDEFDAIETYKGDVWSFTTEGAVGNPNPSNGAVDVKQTQIITWSPGVFAASHQVYFGNDQEAVRNADTGSPEYKGTGDLGAESYDPGMLEWDTAYYWRIDEVNNTNPDSPWTGILWSFTTANFLIADDFESYNDLDPADPESNRIFNVWIDGYDNPTNGSLVGYEAPPFAEQTIVHGGNQSMPLYYDNSVGYSEATLTLTYPRDWTEKGVNTLTIWFRGDSANAAETLYVALNGSAVVNHDNPNAAQVDNWTEWNIDLQAFADQGVNLANVNTIALGLGNKNNPQAGGSGLVFFDDIRLYRPAPEPTP
ncbi:MAG TPA: LamG domain-containing protein [Sedimentisphaerales bacterium]|nr:LamG domain-containing protein [Sedimentisphaerales bacterium]